MPEGKKPDLSLREKEKLKVCLVMEIKSIGKNKDIQEKTKICKIKLKCSWFATARSCFSGRMQENQGFWEIEREFLYQIYTKRMWIWGCDVVEESVK